LLRAGQSQVSKPGGGEIFRTHPDLSWGTRKLLYEYNGYQFFPEGKAAGSWPWSPTLSSAETKERVELCLYSTSGPLWPVEGESYLHFTSHWRVLCYFGFDKMKKKVAMLGTSIKIQRLLKRES